jgi:hypothetical protein
MLIQRERIEERHAALAAGVLGGERLRLRHTAGAYRDSGELGQRAITDAAFVGQKKGKKIGRSLVKNREDGRWPGYGEAATAEDAPPCCKSHLTTTGVRNV